MVCRAFFRHADIPCATINRDTPEDATGHGKIQWENGTGLSCRLPEGKSVKGALLMRMTVRVIALAAVFCLSLAFANGSGATTPSEYEPPNGKGRAVVVVSGQSGPGNYRDMAKDLAAQGYYVVLVDGNDYWGKGVKGREAMKEVLAGARQSPHALPGRVAVIGLSLGGASTLSFAARMPELVSAVVLYYPMTSYIKDARDFVSGIKVPTLMFAGGRDVYKNCCAIDAARQMADAARAGGKALLEVVEYPEAGHGFTIRGSKEWRAEDTADAFSRTLDHLRRYGGE
jgi:dienelactone hydrolase